MSVVPMTKVTLYGLAREKLEVLDDLQGLGCLHIVPSGQAPVAAGAEPSPDARRALKFLLGSPRRRHQSHDASRFDAAAVQRRALEIESRMHALRDEQDFQRKRARELAPWGDFRLPDAGDHPELRLWFYIVPHYLMKRVPDGDLTWQIVHRDNRSCYVVVVAREEPAGMPVARTHTGSRPLSELTARLEAVELELDDLQAERESLTRWCDLLARDLDRLEDRAALQHAAGETYDSDPLFVLSGWCPRDAQPALQALARRQALALVLEHPGEDDDPPTLLRNPGALAGGQDLVRFYLTPAYRLWDPSSVVFVSFVAFFALILSDAGYAVVLGAVVGLLWRRLSRSESRRRLRNLAVAIVAGSVCWGAAVGSYFGLRPPAGGWLAAMQVVDASRTQTMMALSVGIGILHLVVANLASAWNQRASPQAWVPLGWVAMLLAGAVLWTGSSHGVGWLQAGGAALGGAGAAAVLICSSAHRNPLHRLLDGLLGLTRVSAAFGDVLSYLRLFALGFATASLAGAFNQLAAMASAALPALGVLAGALVLMLGHALNFVLGVTGAVVHGLRLNYIEFFNWGLRQEGYPFRPFARKEPVK
jgi:V/A-type H+-transporting ATPase subunit I